MTGGIVVVAADTGVLDAISGELAAGRFLDDASSQVPTVVLGADAAERLGIHSTSTPAPRSGSAGSGSPSSASSSRRRSRPTSTARR